MIGRPRRAALLGSGGARACGGGQRRPRYRERRRRADDDAGLPLDKAGKGGDGNSLEPAISADGRYVAFASRAKNLSPAAKSGKREIFVKDMQTGDGDAGLAGRRRRRGPPPRQLLRPLDLRRRSLRRLRLRRREPQRRGRRLQRRLRPRPPRRDDDAGLAGLGRDRGRRGRRVDRPRRSPPTAVTSPSSPAPTTSSPTTRRRSRRDVFVRDLDTGVTELVSRASGATGAAATDYSFEPSISADGSRVAFSSRAPLVADDVDEQSFPQDVFVRDRATATTILVSRKSGAGGAPSDVESDEPAISADGLHVAFASDAKLTGQRGFDSNVFVRDLSRRNRPAGLGRRRGQGRRRQAPRPRSPPTAATSPSRPAATRSARSTPTAASTSSSAT